MSYLALYRKWRPASFDEVKGQDAIVKTLRNQIIYNRIGHAYLFCGTRGTGKTSIAKLFARAVNCEQPEDGSPCGQCSSCRSILEGSSFDVIEIDAASNNGVDNIRQIREQVQYMPVNGSYKVYIIDEVHMLSSGAFNALLKTLEEPPSYVIFILATTEKHRIPVTILSRCQQYDFRRISVDTITAHLQDLMEKEGIEAQPKALSYIARAADGSMRDALSLLDQCISFYMDQTLTYDKVLDVLGASDTTVFGALTKALINKDTPHLLDLIDDVVTEGRELSQFLTDYLWYLRNLLLLKDQVGSEDSLDMSSETIESMKEEAGLLSTPALLYYIRSLSDLSGQLRNSTQKRILLETGFIRLSCPEMDASADALVTRIESLEAALREGAVTRSAPVRVSPVSDTVPVAAKETKTRPSLSPDEALEARFSPAEAKDLRNIAGKWKEIVGSTDNPMRRHLRQARVAVADDSTVLQLIFDAENLLSENAKAYFEKNNRENLEYLSDLVAKRTGKKAQFTCLLSSPAGRRNTDTIDLSKIHMDIEFEE